MTTKHEKFELEELSKAAVVNSSVHAKDHEVEQMINDVVTDHLSKIVDEDSDKEDDLHDLEEKEVDDSLESRKIADEDLNQSQNLDIDIEALKEEYYQKGLAESKEKYEAIISENGAQGDLSELLVQKLNMVVPINDIDAQVSKVSAEAISGIAKKLHLILPANFEEIISSGLINKLKSFYKEGSIVLTINPERETFCKELLQSEAIPSKLKDNFQIALDDKLGSDDCILDWDETRLEYSQEQLTEEINIIIERLKSAM